MRFVQSLSLLALLALTALIVGLSAAAAQSPKSCAPFPHVPWWGDMTHETVRNTVRDRYAGDWRPVIDGLTQQMAAMRTLKEQGRPFPVPNSTRQLGGDQLDVYLDQVRLTLSILSCLRDTTSARRAPAPATAPGQS